MRTFRRSVHYFERVAQSGSVRAAAEVLHVAPSAVSRAVQQLEQELGVALFDRTSRGLHLTAAGETLLGYLRRWERESEQLGDAVRSLSGVRLETVRIATVEVASYELVPQAIAAVRRRVPGVRAEMRIGDTALVTENIANGSADIGVTINMPKTVPARPLWTMITPLGLVTRADHPLARRRSVSLAECLGEPLVLPEVPLAARASLRRALESAGPYRIAASSNRIVGIRSLVRAGLGPAFLIKMDVAAEVRAGEFAYVPLEDQSIEHPYISIIAPRATNRSAVIDLLIETLRRAMPRGEFRA
jgi:DNA-binding transcriptional LysR family regulator